MEACLVRLKRRRTIDSFRRGTLVSIECRKAGPTTYLETKSLRPSGVLSSIGRIQNLKELKRAEEATLKIVHPSLTIRFNRSQLLKLSLSPWSTLGTILRRWDSKASWSIQCM